MRALHWFRNDLRLRDNTALAAAAAAADEIIPCFVLDERLLEGPTAGAPRTRFLLDCLDRLARDLEARGSRLIVRRGDPALEIEKLLGETRAELLAFNRDYSPYARARDAKVRARAARSGARVLERKDRVVFESEEVRTAAGGAYAVYTPYRNAWQARFEEDPQPPSRAPRFAGAAVLAVASDPLPDVSALERDSRDCELPRGGEAAALRRLARFLEHGLRDYARQRDLPAVDGTSRLSPYLRFGAVSVRECVHAAKDVAREDRSAAAGARKWIDELIWREFYLAILNEHPRVLRESYRSEYDSMEWNDDEKGLAAWCEGRTGYPIVDAGMRQLARSAWMHNRVRMIAASFLTKDLLLDWRLGERFFLKRLADGDPASNNGGWQWAASTGTDAQPYFRIFNPVSQGERFDPGGEYVRRWIPELRGVEDRFVHHPWDAKRPPDDYPPPIVSHAERRALALRRYEAARGAGRGR